MPSLELCILENCCEWYCLLKYPGKILQPQNPSIAVGLPWVPEVLISSPTGQLVASLDDSLFCQRKKSPGGGWGVLDQYLGIGDPLRV